MINDDDGAESRDSFSKLKRLKLQYHHKETWGVISNKEKVFIAQQ